MNETQESLQPFSTSYTPALPELLYKLGVTVVLSTYQAGKVVFVSARDEDFMVQLPRTFPVAMGVAVEGNKLAIASSFDITILNNDARLAAGYPKKPNVYDAMYLPTATYHTGETHMHDIDFVQGKLWGVNTRYSCLCRFDEQYNFVPEWKPPFISELLPEDRCHLNGMALGEDGEPQFVTMFSETNTAGGWRSDSYDNGIVMDVSSNEIVARGLAMPHSPRIHNGELYVLLSAEGVLAKVDVQTGAVQRAYDCGGFARGLAFAGDYAILGISRIRLSSSTFKDLPIAQKKAKAGFEVVHLPTMTCMGKYEYLASVDEIYDVQVLPNTRRPNILNTIAETHKLAASLPDKALWLQAKTEEG